MSSNLYPYQPTHEDGPYRLTRDGKEILVGTEGECWTWIHRNCGYSVEHALRYEGYRMEPYAIPTVPGCDACSRGDCSYHDPANYQE